MRDLEIFSKKTRMMYPPKDDIFEVLSELNLDLKDRDMVFIATKCLSIHQGRCVPISEADKMDLVRSEADRSLKFSEVLTEKDGVIIPYSGIDESNGNGYYILWPHPTAPLLQSIHHFLCQQYGLLNLGIVSVDSKIDPLRKGTTGVAQATYGFHPNQDIQGKKDLFDRALRMTTVNIADSLAATACLLMGESSECTPIVIARGHYPVIFEAGDFTEELKMPASKDWFHFL